MMAVHRIVLVVLAAALLLTGCKSDSTNSTFTGRLLKPVPNSIESRLEALQISIEATRKELKAGK